MMLGTETALLITLSIQKLSLCHYWFRCIYSSFISFQSCTVVDPACL